MMMVSADDSSVLTVFYSHQMNMWTLS